MAELILKFIGIWQAGLQIICELPADTRRRSLSRLMIRRSRRCFVSGWLDCHIPTLRSNVLLITDISYLFFRPNLH